MTSASGYEWRNVNWQQARLRFDAGPGIRGDAELETLIAFFRARRGPAVGFRFRDPYDNSNIFLEIRAGTGGDEAAIFAGDLFRMYSRYAELRHWQVEVLSESPGEHGGYKEIIARVEGQGAYSRLKFESGAHRVQRVPETESQGRIHTSAATVAILPEADEIDPVEINPAVIPVGRAYFGFEPEKVNLALVDGRYFVNKTRRKYDAICLDAFLGDSCPSHLMTREAFAAMSP